MTNDQFVTAFYGILDVKRKTFVYCNAGHVPPLLISPEPDDPPMNLKTGIALCLCECSDMMGSKSALRYRDEHIQLRKGTKVLLYTDGLLEAVRLNGKKGDFHETVFNSVLETVKPLNATETVDTIKNRLIEFRGEESFDDDICIVCV
jgi:serine phosphatase RsbU (regulator of sigma subunit)